MHSQKPRVLMLALRSPSFQGHVLLCPGLRRYLVAQIDFKALTTDGARAIPTIFEDMRNLLIAFSKDFLDAIEYITANHSSPRDTLHNLCINNVVKFPELSKTFIYEITQGGWRLVTFVPHVTGNRYNTPAGSFMKIDVEAMNTESRRLCESLSDSFLDVHEAWNRLAISCNWNSFTQRISMDRDDILILVNKLNRFNHSLQELVGFPNTAVNMLGNVVVPGQIMGIV